VTYLAAPITYTLPRHVYSEPQWREDVEVAIAEWNACRSGLFVMVDDPNVAEVKVITMPGRTWVQMPLTSPQSIVYVGNDIQGLMAHELGHTLNLADHIFPDMDTTGYINPQSTEDGYRGVMSYAATREQWFGNDDVTMLIDVFPLTHRVVVPELSRQCHYEQVNLRKSYQLILGS